MASPWRRSDSVGSYSTWNSSYGASQQSAAPPQRIYSGRSSPGQQAAWHFQNSRSLSVGAQVPSPPPNAPFSPIAAGSPVPPVNRAQAHPHSGRPRLASSPGRVYSASPSGKMSSHSPLPPSPTVSGNVFSFSPDRATPTKLASLPEASSPSLKPLPPVRVLNFQRRHSSPTGLPIEEPDEQIFEISPPKGSHMPPSPVRLQPPTPTHMLTTPSPMSSPTSPLPPSLPASTDISNWRRGSDRPKTSGAGRKPAYGVASLTGRCPGMLKENQDGFFMYEHAERKDIVAGVLDGHGVNGRQVSSFVQDHLARSIIKNNHSSTELPTPRRLENAFSETASALQGTGIDATQSGTTAVAVMRKGEDLYIANVGDSRCVLAREENSSMRAVPLSKDHKPDTASERDRIAKAGGFVEPTLIGSSFQGPHRVWRRRQIDGGLAVSRSIGDTALESAGVVPQPDVIRLAVTAQDKFVVMASDGVWDQLSNEQVVAIAALHEDPRAASTAIVREARRRWERDGAYVDDITAMVIKM